MLCADNVKNKIFPLFSGFYDSLMFSYFDGILGKGFCDDLNYPKTALICCGDFYFAAGKPAYAADILNIIGNNPYAVIVPDSDEFAELLINFDERLYKAERFHTEPPENGFDRNTLENSAERINRFKDLRLEKIDRRFYELSLGEDWSSSFVINFKSYEDYSRHGFGYIITDGEKILSGTSTFSYYDKGVEIEVSTDPEHRLNGFAQITASAFLLECMKRHLIPHWDARNRTSLSIAEKMGFKFKDCYTALEFKQNQ